jgi:hypothetical protein
MKPKLIITAIACALSIALISCSSEEGDKAGKPAFMQKNDSMSKLPPMGDTSIKEGEINH